MSDYSYDDDDEEMDYDYDETVFNDADIPMMTNRECSDTVLDGNALLQEQEEQIQHVVDLLAVSREQPLRPYSPTFGMEQRESHRSLHGQQREAARVGGAVAAR